MKPWRTISGFVMVVVTASAWLFAETIFTAPSPGAGGLLVLLAAVLAVVWSVARHTPERFELRYLILVPFLAMAAWWLPWPLSLGPLVLIAALAFGGFSYALHETTPIRHGLALLGAVMVLQGLLVYPTTSLMTRCEPVGWLARVVAALLRFAGADASALDGRVTLMTIRAAHAFPLVGGLVGLPVALLALAGAAALLVASRPAKHLRAFGVLIAAWLVYLPLRAAVMILVFEQLQLYVDYATDVVRVDVLWNPWLQLASFTPLAIAWGLLLREDPDAAARPALSRYRAKPRTLAFACLAVGTLLAVTGAFWHDTGTRAAKRVLIDEVHSDWEKSTHAPGTHWYGTLSMYNMFSIVDYLGYYYEVERWTKTPDGDNVLTDGRLADVDVLILKTPTAPYGEEEIDAVERFVRRGGGLFMIGEHTNFVGTAVYLNAIGRRFGVRFREDGLFNLNDASPYRHIWRRPEIYSHPVAANIPFYRFEVSCSVTGTPWFTEDLFANGGMYQRNADYHMNNYYPFPTKISDMGFGPYAAAVAANPGRGRVVAFGDSTTFSNFSAFYPGRAELMLGAVDWTGRRHGIGVWRWTLAIIGLATCVVGFVVLAGLPDRLGTLVVIAAALAFAVAVGMGVIRWHDRRSMSLPTAHTRPVHVGFVQEGCDYELPITDFVLDRDRSRDMLFEWMLRLRYFPRVRDTLADARDDQLVVLVNPSDTLLSPGGGDLPGFVRRGGNVLVLLNATGESRGDRLVEAFGMSVDRTKGVVSGIVSDSTGKPAGAFVDALALAGGETVYRIGETPVAVSAPLGEGRVTVIGFGEAFADAGMGFSNATVPDETLAPRYRLLFDLVARLVPPAKHLPEPIAAEVQADLAR